MKQSHWLTVLVLFLPVAVVLRWLNRYPSMVFAGSALAILPLAGWMGNATEQLAERYGPGIGGLLNATFGNAAELILGAIAVYHGFIPLVKASITGSIIGNLLLVTGVSIIAGGLRYPRQQFSRTAAGLGSTMMALSVAGLLVPAVFHGIVSAQHIHGDLTASRQGTIELDLSLGISALLFAVYLLNLTFSLAAERDALREEPKRRTAKHRSAAPAIAWLAGSTVGIALASELLVGSVEYTAKAWGMSELFIGVIVVAIVGNAAEHSTAVVMALKNKLDISMSIATGSSLQIALLVAPILVFLGDILNKPMDLRFSAFEVLSMASAVGLAHLVVQDGETNWMEGVLLVALYIMLGFAFYFIPAS